jgi:hypothetical protein
LKFNIKKFGPRISTEMIVKRYNQMNRNYKNVLSL